MTRFNLLPEIEQPKKSAKTTLFNIGTIALKAFGVPEEISFLGFSYNIVNKLKEELAKRDEALAQKALEEIKKELETA